MKSRAWMWMTVVYLFAALAMPVWTAAQDNPSPDNHHRHHQYRLIDIGTFGGPTSYNFSENAQPMNSRGIVTGQADTSIPDPNYPNFNPLVLVSPDPFLQHAFSWSHGVLVDLGALPGQNSSVSDWINGSGVVAGASTTGSIDPFTGWPAAEAVIWKNGRIIGLGDLGGHESIALVVNDREEAGGFADNTIPDPFSLFGFPTQTRAFVWTRGVMRDIGTLGGPDAAGGDISNYGMVGISYTNSTPNPTTGIPTVDPFLWKNGEMIDLGTLGGNLGNPEWINNRGQVVGRSNLAGDLIAHPFLWDDGVLKDLGTLGGDNGVTFFINEAGAAVGETDLAGNAAHHAFLWKRGVMSDLGTVGGDPCSNGTHINAQEQIIGTSTNCHGVVLHTFLWENGEMVDLNSLVSPPSDAKLVDPSYINDRGQITGNAILPNGDEHAVVLIPEGDCDSDCEGRIAASQNNAVPTQNAATRKQGSESPLSPAERFRSQMRQRYHLSGQPAAPRD